MIVKVDVHSRDDETLVWEYLAPDSMVRARVDNDALEVYDTIDIRRIGLGSVSQIVTEPAASGESVVTVLTEGSNPSPVLVFAQRNLADHFRTMLLTAYRKQFPTVGGFGEYSRG